MSERVFRCFDELPEQQRELLERYGYANNLCSAGFVLADGSLVAMDYEHEHDYVAWRALGGVFPLEELLDSGAMKMRYSAPNCYLVFRKRPTQQQAGVVGDICVSAGNVVVDWELYGERVGKPIKSESFCPPLLTDMMRFLRHCENLPLSRQIG